MQGLATCAALVLAAIFAAAAVAKARRPAATAATFRDLGLPAPDALARVVPVAEAAVAGALVAVPSLGAVAALTMLAFFTTFLAGRLRAGEAVPCGCFGTTSTAPISFVEIVRNGLLAAGAAVALAADRPALPAVEDVVATGAAVAAAAMVLALCALKRDIGSVWRTTLAGEGQR